MSGYNPVFSFLRTEEEVNYALAFEYDTYTEKPNFFAAREN